MLVADIGRGHLGAGSARRVESMLDIPVVVEHYLGIHTFGSRLCEEHPLVQAVGTRGGERQQRRVIGQIDVVLMQVEREILQ